MNLFSMKLILFERYTKTLLPTQSHKDIGLFLLFIEPTKCSQKPILAWLVLQRLNTTTSFDKT